MLSRVTLIASLLTLVVASPALVAQDKQAKPARYLYVSSRDGAGGRGDKGIYVYDVDNGHKLVKFIAMPELGGTRGMCGCAKTGKLWIAHNNDKLLCMDIKTEKVDWEKQFPKEEGGCDRIGVTPAGDKLYVPSGWWSAGKNVKVFDAPTGKLLKNIEVAEQGGLHNLIVTNDGKQVVVGSTRENMLTVIDAAKDEVVRKVGPIIGVIQPLTVNGDQSLAYINTHLYQKGFGPGFEIGDLKSGKILHTVGIPKLAERKTRCHGVGLTPDEKEVWVVDQDNKEVHVFDNTAMPPRFMQSIPMSDKVHGWVCFSRDGKYAWIDTGEVIDVASKKVVAQLVDANGMPVMSSKFFELHMLGGNVAWIGQQMGVGFGKKG